MRITDIKQQVKRADRYSIYADGKYLFSLSESELLNTGIKINQEIDKSRLTELKKTAQLDKAYDRSLNLISRRIRSRWEIEQYLTRKEYNTEIIEETLNMLSKRGYVNDEEFAHRWVVNRRLLKKTSKRRLLQELRAKRVNQEIIDQALKKDEADEKEILLDLIEKKRSQSRYKDNEKLMAYLMRQGFNYGDIKEALTR